jgi:hypothetical protein
MLSARFLPESTGDRWSVEQYSGRKFFGLFSGGFLPNSCIFRQGLGRKHWRKSENFPAGILLPQNHQNYPEPAGLFNLGSDGIKTYGNLTFKLGFVTVVSIN